MNEQYLSLLKNPTGLSMDMMAERLLHLIPLIDFTEIKSIFDIGAAHGYESLNLARVFSHATVHGFEPTPEHYRACIKHYAELPKWINSRIGISNIALNDADGEISFYPLADNAQSNNTGMASKFKLIDPLVFPHEHNLQKEIKVSALTLDTWCWDNGRLGPDLIWMDAQGAELDILKGGIETLKTVKVIMTEAALKPYYHGHTLKIDIDKFLEQHGFTELVSARKLMHEYEVDAIYLRKL